MSRKSRLSADQVDHVESFMDGMFDLVTSDAEALAGKIVAVRGIPHEAVAELNRFLLKLQSVRQAGAKMVDELREPGSRPLH